MPRKNSEPDPGPAGTSIKLPRAMAVPLGRESEALIRRVNKATRIPIGELVAEITKSAELEDAVRAAIERAHTVFKAGLDRALHGPADVPKEKAPE